MKGDTISRSALIAEIKKWTTDCACIELIENEPTVDAAPLIRCRECRKCMTQECMLCSFDIDGYCTGGPDGDFYCADGARMDGGEEI